MLHSTALPLQRLHKLLIRSRAFFNGGSNYVEVKDNLTPQLTIDVKPLPMVSQLIFGEESSI